MRLSKFQYSRVSAGIRSESPLISARTDREERWVKTDWDSWRVVVSFICSGCVECGLENGTNTRNKAEILKLDYLNFESANILFTCFQQLS